MTTLTHYGDTDSRLRHTHPLASATLTYRRTTWLIIYPRRPRRFTDVQEEEMLAQLRLVTTRRRCFDPFVAWWAPPRAVTVP